MTRMVKYAQLNWIIKWEKYFDKTSTNTKQSSKSLLMLAAVGNSNNLLCNRCWRNKRKTQNFSCAAGTRGAHIKYIALDDQPVTAVSVLELRYEIPSHHHVTDTVLTKQHDTNKAHQQPAGGHFSPMFLISFTAQWIDEEFTLMQTQWNRVCYMLHNLIECLTVFWKGFYLSLLHLRS